VRRKNISSVAAGLLGALALGCASMNSAIGNASGESGDVSQITRIENELARETDIDKVMPYYAQDAVLVDFDLPGWYEGHEQIRDAIQPQLASLQSIKYRIEEISVASDGNLACTAMQIHFDATKKDQSRLGLSIRQIDAFKKIDGQWRIIQQHFSVPVDQKTSAPIFDAKLVSRGPLLWSRGTGPDVTVNQAKKDILHWLITSETPQSIDEMKGYYDPNQHFLIFDWWSPREVRGHRELVDFYSPSFVGVRNMEIKVPEIKIETDGTLGMQISKQHLAINMKDGTRQLISFRQSDCVHRIGNTWYSFYEMGSFPVDSRTGKAIMSEPAAFASKEGFVIGRFPP
jgi:ketosteroid isomerase-like protein